jgi:hypothetical protein
MRSRTRMLQGVVVASIALGSSPALAQVPDADGTYYGCYNRADGYYRLIASPLLTCKKSEVLVAWNILPGGDSLLTATIDAEIKRAKGAESILGNDLSAEITARKQADGETLAEAKAYADGLSGSAIAPICRGRPGGTCSVTAAQACAYDNDCPTGEVCEWTQLFSRFHDNGNGTVTDRRTCLQWEKKTGTVGTWVMCPGGPTCSDLHHVNNFGYQWGLGWGGGTTTAEFLRALNDAAFAGHSDWRLPTVAGKAGDPTGNDPELESILLAPYPCATSPCIDTSFGPTAAAVYWSSGMQGLEPYGAYPYGVDFSDGRLGLYDSHLAFVRAVRGGVGAR